MIYMAVGIAIFFIVFYLMITEKVPGPWATMIGGLIMALVGIINEEDALEAISERLEILFLLIGMIFFVFFVFFFFFFFFFVRGEPFR